MVIIVSLLTVITSQAQEKNAVRNKHIQYRNFPIVAGIQFHSLSLPAKDVSTSFSNVGFRLGTEVSFNGKQNWVQSFTIGGYRNKHAGNGAFAFTQTVYRPTVINNFYAEVKAGIGALHNYHPTDAFHQQNGEWINDGKKGKTMLTAPIGIGFGYNGFKNGMYFSPFISYEFWVLNKYNDDLDYLPSSVIQIGTRIHL